MTPEESSKCSIQPVDWIILRIDIGSHIDPNDYWSLLCCVDAVLRTLDGLALFDLVFADRGDGVKRWVSGVGIAEASVILISFPLRLIVVAAAAFMPSTSNCALVFRGKLKIIYFS